MEKNDQEKKVVKFPKKSTSEQTESHGTSHGAKQKETKHHESQHTTAKKPAHSKAFTISLFVILILISVAFILVPVMGSVGGKSKGGVLFATYEKEKIEYTSSNPFGQYVENYSRTFGQDPLSLLPFIYDLILRETFILHRLKSINFNVSDQRVAQIIVSDYFQDDQQKFDAEAYRIISEREKTNLKEAVFRQEMLAQFDRDNTMGVFRSQKGKDFLRTMGRERRTFEYAYANPDEYPLVEIKKYVEENKELFRLLELERITLAKESSVTAEDLLKEIKEDGALFSEVASKSSGDSWANSGGYVGPVYAYELESRMDLSKEQAETLLTTSDEYPVLKNTREETVIFHLVRPIEAPNYESEDFIQKVRDYLNRNEADVISNYYTTLFEKIDTAVKGGKSLQAAVQESGEVHLGESLPLSLNYKDSELFVGKISEGFPDESAFFTQGISEDAEFLQALFSLENVGDSTGLKRRAVSRNEIFTLFVLKERTDSGDEEVLSDRVDELFASSYGASALEMVKGSPTFTNHYDEAVVTLSTPAQ